MKYFLAAVAVIGLLTASAAKAAIVTAEWTGSLSSGTDQNGLLGVAGANLAGDTFQLTFKFDTTKGVFVKNPGDTLEGGTAYAGEGASPGSAVLTIAGHDIDYDGGYFSYFGVSPASAYCCGGSGSTHAFSALDAVNPSLNSVSINAFKSPQLTNSMTTSYSGNPCVGAVDCGGSFSFGPANGELIFGSLATTSYELSFDGPFVDPLAVPEPAVWGLMLLGFGLAGSELRRRRTQVTA
jgi:PEP-CTERM motif-containing protein